MRRRGVISCVLCSLACSRDCPQPPAFTVTLTPLDSQMGLLIALTPLDCLIDSLYCSEGVS